MPSQPPRMTRLMTTDDGRLEAVIDPGDGFDLVRLDLGPIGDVEPAEMIPPRLHREFFRELDRRESRDGLQPGQCRELWVDV